jgi:hypothetical protein
MGHIMATSKLVSKPIRPAPTDAQVDAFIAAAPDSLPPAVSKIQPGPPAALSDVPRELRKRKEPITVTVSPDILVQFDRIAASLGLSRAAALGLAMTRFIALEKREAGN